MNKDKVQELKDHKLTLLNGIYSLNDPDLSHSAKAILVRLVHLDMDVEHIFFSNSAIAKDLNLSVRSVITALGELQERDYINRQKQHRSGPRFTEINHKQLTSKLMDEHDKSSPEWLTGYQHKPRNLRERVTPNCVYSLDDDRMGQIAKAMLVRLVHLDWTMDPLIYSNDKLSKDLNLSLRSVVNATSELLKSGYIDREEPQAGKARLTRVNHEQIISRLFEKPRTNRHREWLTGHYKKLKNLK